MLYCRLLSANKLITAESNTHKSSHTDQHYASYLCKLNVSVLVLVSVILVTWYCTAQTASLTGYAADHTYTQAGTFCTCTFSNLFSYCSCLFISISTPGDAEPKVGGSKVSHCPFERVISHCVMHSVAQSPLQVQDR